MKSVHRSSILVLILLLLTASLSSACRDGVDSAEPGGDEATLTGYLSVVRNGHTLFILFDETGKKYDLLIEDALLQAHGGALAMDRKNITVRGVWSADSPDTLIVNEIQQLQP